MTEEDAQTWLVESLAVSRETQGLLRRYHQIVIDGMSRQNLIAESTRNNFWARHIVDSAQLGRFTRGAGSWLDLGSGAGMPGVVLAIIRPEIDMHLVEARAKRGDFLSEVADSLDLQNVTIHRCRVEALAERKFDTITARAFAPLKRLLTLAYRFSTPETRWLLPKGKNATSELEDIASSWQGVFSIERSVTDPGGGIIVATGIKSKGKQ